MRNYCEYKQAGFFRFFGLDGFSSNKEEIIDLLKEIIRAILYGQFNVTPFYIILKNNIKGFENRKDSFIYKRILNEIKNKKISIYIKYAAILGLMSDESDIEDKVTMLILLTKTPEEIKSLFDQDLTIEQIKGELNKSINPTTIIIK